MSFWGYICIILPAILVGLGAGLYFFQEQLIFYPEKLSKNYHFRFDIPFKEMVFLMEDKNKINALLFSSEEKRGLVYYHHGNAGNLDTWGRRAQDFTEKGYDVLMYDYRGFGKSTGKVRNEKTLYGDALFIYNELLQDYRAEEMIIYGISLGTGIAARLARENTCRKLFLETPYTNFYDVAKYQYPYLPNSILLHYRFKTDRLIHLIEVPVVIFHGTEDETVPYYMGEKLSKLSDKIILITIDGGAHNNLNTYKVYQDALIENL